MRTVLAAAFMMILSVPALGQHHNHVKQGTAKPTVSVTGELKRILSANDELFEALLGKDQGKVESAAASLLNELSAISSPELKHLTQGQALATIKKENTKTRNLESYSKFMSHLAPALKVTKVDGYAVYFCPMIQREWVQNEKRHAGVRNVFAQEMLECGERIK